MLHYMYMFLQIKLLLQCTKPENTRTDWVLTAFVSCTSHCSDISVSDIYIVDNSDVSAALYQLSLGEISAHSVAFLSAGFYFWRPCIIGKLQRSLKNVRFSCFLFLSLLSSHSSSFSARLFIFSLFLCINILYPLLK